MNIFLHESTIHHVSFKYHHYFYPLFSVKWISLSHIPDYIYTQFNRKTKGHPVYGNRVSEERVGVRIMGHGGQRGGGGEGERGK